MIRRKQPSTIADPRCAELDAMLFGIEPRRELVYRIAIVGCRLIAGEIRRGVPASEHCGPSCDCAKLVCWQCCAKRRRLGASCWRMQR